MKLTDIRDSFKIDMIETTRGCPEACLHCGAYTDFNREQLLVQSLDPIRLKGRLETIDPSTGLRLIDLCNRFITTFVNTEPLRTQNFTSFARLTHTLSGGKSQVIAISHGLWTGHAEMRRNLEEIIVLMEDGTIPLFVLTVDQARARGKIPPEINLASYCETLHLLRQVLLSRRVTVSLQGSPDTASPLFIGKTKQMFDEALSRLSLSPDEREHLIIDTRSYTNIGRSKTFLHLSQSEECDVIPDPDFVKQHLPTNHAWRGMIRFDGELVVQRNRPGQTYGDSVDPTRWETVTI